MWALRLTTREVKVHYNNEVGWATSGRRQPKTLLTIDERGSKSLETVFLIAICRQLGDK